jgi:hypothetical protein
MCIAKSEAQSLKIHVCGGSVWYRNGTGIPRTSRLTVPAFMDSSVLRAADRVKLSGTQANAEMITRLYEAKQQHDLESVRVITPRIITATAAQRDPAGVLYQLEYSDYARRAPSQGGFHEVVDSDYRSYALAAALQQSNRDGMFDECDVLRLLQDHPAWRPLSFITSLNKVAVAQVLGYILDPRWHVAPEHPDRAGRLEGFLGLDPKTQAGVSGAGRQRRHHQQCQAVLDSWKDTRYEPAVREAFERTTPIPLNETDVPGHAPCDFAWRVWGMRLGIGLLGSRVDAPTIADLRASQMFIRFLRLVWLSELYRDSLAMPEQNAPLFRLSDFFKHPAEAAAYVQHQVGTGIV